MSKKIKVLILVKNVDSGTGTFALQLLGLKRYFNVILCVLQKEKYRMVDQRIYYFRKKAYENYYKLSPLLILRLLREIVWLVNIIKKENPQIIICIDLHCNLLAEITKVLLRQNTKTIFTTHNNLSAVTERKLSPFLKQPLLLIGKILYNNANVIVCVSKGVAEDVRKFFSLRREITTIPYGLDVQSVRIKSKENLPKNEDDIFRKKAHRIISIGRFDAQKDFFTLIRAFSLIKNEFKSAKLLLLGDGFQKTKLIKLVSDLKITDYVHFLGWKRNVYPYIKKSDVLVLSSYYEGFGYVLLEAMCLGIPVISTDSKYGPSELLDNGRYGKLIPVGNPEKMSKVIKRLLSNRKEYIYFSKKSLERALFYSEKKMLRAYKDLLGKIMNIEWEEYC